MAITLAAFALAGCGNKPQTKEMKESNQNELTMLVGTYTSGASKGIYTYKFNQENGTHTSLSMVEVSNPSYLTLTDDNRYVYAVSEDNNGSEKVTAFEFNRNKGTLKELNNVPARGGAPCYVTTNGKYVITANYSGGNIAVFPISDDGKLVPATEMYQFIGKGTDPERQQKPYLHCVRFSPDGNYLFANDLGTDRIYRYLVNNAPDPEKEENVLTEMSPSFVSVEQGSGPRHLTFSPNGKQAYLINELSGSVMVFDYDDKEGMLNQKQTIQADTVGARGSADIHVSPDGKYLYASNRLKEDGIVVFKIDEMEGTLAKVGYQPTGIHPRNFIITPNGKYLLAACRDSNVIEVYERDVQSGLLTQTTEQLALEKPVCIQFANP